MNESAAEPGGNSLPMVTIEAQQQQRARNNDSSSSKTRVPKGGASITLNFGSQVAMKRFGRGCMIICTYLLAGQYYMAMKTFDAIETIFDNLAIHNSTESVYDLDVPAAVMPTAKNAAKNTFDSVYKVGDDDAKYNPRNFSYDYDRWKEIPRKVAITAGPHKSGSSTIQWFLANLLGTTYGVEKGRRYEWRNYYKPLLQSPTWRWPIGAKEDYTGPESVGGGLHLYLGRQKFFAELIFWLEGHLYWTKTKTDEEKKKLFDYFRRLFRTIWDDGNNIVLGTEDFDTLVRFLPESTQGLDLEKDPEAIHVAPKSGEIIGKFLDLLPFDDPNELKDNSLSMEEIEVQINYRTRRIDHVISAWNQIGPALSNATLREFFPRAHKSQRAYHTTNSLALALQFVRAGIKTTIIDMAGLAELEANDPPQEEDYSIVGGFRGIIACDILGLDSCIDERRLQLPRHRSRAIRKLKKKTITNKRDAPNVLDISNEELDAMNRAYDEYDCGIWQHLHKYQEQGLLRILYPSKTLFATCNPKGDEDTTFHALKEKFLEIASKNGTIVDDWVVSSTGPEQRRVR